MFGVERPLFGPPGFEVRGAGEEKHFTLERRGGGGDEGAPVFGDADAFAQVGDVEVQEDVLERLTGLEDGVPGCFGA